MPGGLHWQILLGPISIKFQNWTYAQDTVLFLYNESFWRIFNTVCMGLWTGVATAVPCPPLVEVALGGHTPHIQALQVVRRGKSSWPTWGRSCCSGWMLLLHELSTTRSPQKYCADLGGVVWQWGFFFYLISLKCYGWFLFIHLQSFHFYFFYEHFQLYLWLLTWFLHVAAF